MSNYVIRLPEALMRQIINEGIGNLGTQLGATVTQVKAITSIPPVFELIMDTPAVVGDVSSLPMVPLEEEPQVVNRKEISAEFTEISDEMIERFNTRTGTLDDR